MFTARPEHVEGFDYRGPNQYFLTFCTDGRRPHFITADAVAVVRTQIERAASEHYQARFNRRLWQRYGYEHTLRSNEAGISVARYILENPVRAGLVTRIEDYPFSGSSVYPIEQILEAIQLRRKWYRRSG